MFAISYRKLIYCKNEYSWKNLPILIVQLIYEYKVKNFFSENPVYNSDFVIVTLTVKLYA